jgi:hypothetical protein
MIGPYLEDALRKAATPPSREQVEQAAELARQALAASVDADATRRKLSPRSVVSIQLETGSVLQPLLRTMGREEIERQLGPLLTPGAASLLPEAFDTVVTLAEERQPQRGYEV